MRFSVLLFFIVAAFAPVKFASAQDVVELIEPPAEPDAVRSVSVLSATDKEVYAQIFDHLDNGETDAAETLLKTTESDVLRGYVLAGLYLKDDKRAKKQALTNWLYKYKSLAVSDAVYDLALVKKSYLPYVRRADATPHVVAGVCTSVPISDPVDLLHFHHFKYVPDEYRKKVVRSFQYFSSAIRRGKTLAAKLHLNEKHMKKYLSRRDRDDALTVLAFAYIVDRQDDKALETVKEPLERSETRNPMALWVAGLASFRTERWEDAETFFKRLEAHPKALPSAKAAAAFWATRAMMKRDEYVDVVDYLKRAALVSPRSFYGILAQRALGWSIGQTWQSPVKDPDMKKILAEPAGKRAVALIEIGKTDWAQTELERLFAQNKKLRDDITAYVETLVEYPEMREFFAGLNGRIETPDGDKALYPVPNWTPENGWQLDKALVYAFVRQESCFKNKAFSKAGARGVMQLMPSTAKLMARRVKAKYALSKLHKIPFNLMVGQELVKTLLDSRYIQGNLLMTIASYNCGSRNVAKWIKRKDFENDPLMFVETIPSRETRGFVKKVTANYWIYRSLLGEDLSSIDDVLTGRYPVYKSE